jgi:hypothetical protein
MSIAVAAAKLTIVVIAIVASMSLATINKWPNNEPKPYAYATSSIAQNFSL